MSDAPEYDDDNPPPRARQKSSVAKWLLIILGVLGVSGLVCCGGVAYFGREFIPTNSPAVVAEKTQQIAPVTIPVGWTPVMAWNIVLANIVAYAPDGHPEDGMLMLLEVTGDAASGKQIAEQQQQGKGQQMVVEKTTKRTFTIREKEYDFAFSEGKSSSGEVMHMVMGELPSSKPGKVVILMVTQKGDKYDEDSIVEMIESIE